MSAGLNAAIIAVLELPPEKNISLLLSSPTKLKQKTQRCKTRISHLADLLTNCNLVNVVCDVFYTHRDFLAATKSKPNRGTE